MLLTHSVRCLAAASLCRPAPRAPSPAACADAAPALHEAPPLHTSTEAAFRFEQKVTDLGDGIYGLDSRDPGYGIEILRQRVALPLRLALREEAVWDAGGGLRSMALVEAALPGGGAATANFRPGDALTYLLSDGEGAGARRVERVEGLSVDETMEAVQRLSPC